jgi:hypothetical protein
LFGAHSPNDESSLLAFYEFSKFFLAPRMKEWVMAWLCYREPDEDDEDVEEEEEDDEDKGYGGSADDKFDMFGNLRRKWKPTEKESSEAKEENEEKVKVRWKILRSGHLPRRAFPVTVTTLRMAFELNCHTAFLHIHVNELLAMNDRILLRMLKEALPTSQLLEALYLVAAILNVSGAM